MIGELEPAGNRAIRSIVPQPSWQDAVLFVVRFFGVDPLNYDTTIPKWP